MKFWSRIVATGSSPKALSSFSVVTRRASRTANGKVYNFSWRMLVPTPKTASIGGQPLRDTELLTWCGEVIRSVLADLPPVTT